MAPSRIERASPAAPRSFARLLLVLLFLLTGSWAALADEPEDRCRELLPVFVERPGALTVAREGGGTTAPLALRLDWQRAGDSSEPAGHIICWFLPRPQAAGAWQMFQLDSSRFGRLKRYDIQQAYKMLRVEKLYAPQAYAAGDPATVRLLYVLQQTLNGLGLGFVYALIAMGYTMVYGITRVINLAFGPLYAMAAFMALIAWTLARPLGLPAGLLLTFAVTVAGASAWGWAGERQVFRHLRAAPPRVGLIAAIGLAIALQEFLRLAQGPRTRYVLVEQNTMWPLVTGRGFDVVMSRGHALVALATILIGAALWWLHMRTVFGRAQRACAQDARMAALLGVDVDRTVALTFLVGGALVAGAGMFATVQYGVLTVTMGTLMGLKALTAAVLGGIGSLPGAAVGGLIVALTEAFWSAYLPGEWRDVAVFSLLIAVLVFRPQGLFGTPSSVAADERP